MNTSVHETKNKASDSTREVGLNAASSMAEATRGFGKEMGKSVSTISDKAGEYYSQGYDYVKENPVKGVAIAALAGVVAGSILSRRRH